MHVIGARLEFSQLHFLKYRSRASGCITKLHGNIIIEDQFWSSIIRQCVQETYCLCIELSDVIIGIAIGIPSTLSSNGQGELISHFIINPLAVKINIQDQFSEVTFMGLTKDDVYDEIMNNLNRIKQRLYQVLLYAVISYIDLVCHLKASCVEEIAKKWNRFDSIREIVHKVFTIRIRANCHNRYRIDDVKLWQDQ